MKKCNKYIVDPQKGIVVGELTRKRLRLYGMRQRI